MINKASKSIRRLRMRRCQTYTISLRMQLFFISVALKLTVSSRDQYRSTDNKNGMIFYYKKSMQYYANDDDNTDGEDINLIKRTE